MEQLIELAVNVSSKVLVASGILLFRYLEKTTLIKHYKKKIDQLLNEKKE